MKSYLVVRWLRVRLSAFEAWLPELLDACDTVDRYDAPQHVALPWGVGVVTVYPLHVVERRFQLALAAGGVVEVRVSESDWCPRLAAVIERARGALS